MKRTILILEYDVTELCGTSQQIIAAAGLVPPIKTRFEIRSIEESVRPGGPIRISYGKPLEDKKK